MNRGNALRPGALLLATLLAGAAPPALAQQARLGDAFVRLDAGVLTMGNARIVRSFDWNDGALVGRTLEDAQAGRTWTLAGGSPDMHLPGVEEAARGGRLAIHQVPATATRPAHLQAVISANAGGLQTRQTCEVTPGVPAIRCALALKGAAPERWRHADAGAGEAGIETGEVAAADGFFVDRLALPGAHWQARAVRFVPRTDDNDNLVLQEQAWLFRQDLALTGNVLGFSEGGSGAQVFVLREAPADRDQVGWPGADARARIGDVRVSGSGFLASDLSAQRWSEAYATVVGVAGPGDTALQLALRAHQETRRDYRPGRDAMVLSNTWGDRSRDSRMTEAFMLAEIEAAARLGVTHVQLDDGWQAGLSRNSANRAGQRWEDWSAEDWQPHPQRFPRGLAPVAAAARERGVAIGLWFNPSRVDDYAAWERDARILVDAWRRHGVAAVKIDGIEVPSQAAARNLRAMLERVQGASGGGLVFNVDVTAGRRPGYHAMTEYGNLFLENRYTDWGNYYPHRTLRNLWMLAGWMPPQFLQIEVLNPRRNRARYAADDPLAPDNVPLDYAFAATMAAQPLLWMELSGLAPADADTLRAAIAGYGGFRHDWHAGRILPIGQEPSGAAWTGFQSIGGDGRSGIVIVFREPLNREPGALLATRLPANARVAFEPVMGDTRAFTATVAADGGVAFRHAEAGRFSVYRYRLQP